MVPAASDGPEHLGAGPDRRRAEETVLLLAGLRQARQDLDAPGSDNEQFAEQRVARRLAEQLGDDVLDRVDAPDLETTIDLAVGLLDEIAHDPSLPG